MKCLITLAVIELGVLAWMAYQIYQLCTLACAVGAYGW
jgi:hypothetical protein